jgi:hydrogenase maturation protein HypF
MERRAIVVSGIVQGVGFRPFVYSLASRLRLHGFVRNQTSGVLIEIEGEAVSLESFLAEMVGKPPPLARIDQVTWESQEARGERQFRIIPSQVDESGVVFISPDVATCADCLKEVLDPADRRHGYPFLNCTNCGPRLTIITGAPYDRLSTTMAGFTMCELCRAEYENPAHRRFHAQPTACAQCGPRLQLLDPLGHAGPGDPLPVFASSLRVGKIGALKGLGGYHLVCQASNGSAVALLRRRKHRDEKPFAIMVLDISAAEALCQVEAAERRLLLSPRSPIVLLRKREPSPIAYEVAAGNPFLGVMLPYTPLHHLLMRAVNGEPLVMTSGNRSDDPIVFRDDEAQSDLAGIADLFLVHDRPIHVRCDDSVTRVVDGEELPVRRSRGHAPMPVTLPFPCPRPVLAVGGQLKVTFALGRGRQAFLSQHMGDLDYYAAYREFVRDVNLYEKLFAARPACIVHDLHPDYATSRYARERAADLGTELLAVQHHHAHMASCMAEHGLRGPVIGVTFDGTGYGSDGAIWGGEFLVGDYREFKRAAHLRYVGMPGGEKAIREPWRMGISHLLDAGVSSDFVTARLVQQKVRAALQMLKRGFNCPLTSSAGRLFDAVASLIAIRDQVGYEGQAAIELESLASQCHKAGAYPFAIDQNQSGESEATYQIDVRPLIQAIVEEMRRHVDVALIARRFHSTLTEIIVQMCDRIRDGKGIEDVVLSGGVFLNALLSSEVISELRQTKFRVYRHRLVPPNDGGLSLGQLAIGAAKLNHDDVGR